MQDNPIKGAVIMKRRRRKAPASTLRASLGRRMRDKQEWGSVSDYEGDHQVEPFFLVGLLQRMHRYLLIKVTAAVVMVLVVGILYSGGYAWGKPVLETLHFITSWDQDLDVITDRAIPAFRTWWNDRDPALNPGDDVADPVQLPVDGQLISGYGLRRHPQTGNEQMHYGIDLAAPEGTAVAAVLDGVVRSVDESSGVITVTLDHDGGWQTLYRGLSTAAVREGDLVETGRRLGTLGAATLWDSPHLHFELLRDGRPVAPAAQWLEQYRKPVI
jgi:murein DD-endopeptidase MepM/ murein hydrolase activator NlpD